MKWKKNEDRNSEARVEKLAGEVRSAAYQRMEALWSAFLEVGELDMVRAAEKALRLMASHSDYTGAMKLLEGIYALVEIAPPRTSPTASSTPPWPKCLWRSFWRRAGTLSLTWVWMMCWSFL